MAARPTGSFLAGIGGALPERVVLNEELARRVETSDDWIVERTGIRRRHLAGPGDSVAGLGAAAARRALADAGATPADVDAILVATSTPDQAFPAAALRIQASLGVTRGFGFDLSAACSGFVYALSVADALLRTGQAGGVLVVGSEIYSRIVDWEDRATCVLFGDGAGAVFLRPPRAEEAGRGILSTRLHADGRLGDILQVDPHTGRLAMNGREVFRHAVAHLAELVEETLAENQLTPRDIDWLVPHQANIRIIEATRRKLGLPAERVVVTVDRHANTSAASIPLALAEAKADGRLRPEQTILLEALGGGLGWGSALVRL